MISTRNRFLFIHIPKTAGTSLSDVLLPLSDDRTYPVAGGGVSVDSFGVTGPITWHKHMNLREYLVMGQGRFDDYLLLSAVRHPLDRMLSYYFHPGRWVQGRMPLGLRAGRRTRSRSAQRILVKAQDPFWDMSRFLSLIAQSQSHSDFLRRPDGSVASPDWLLDLTSPAACMRDLRLLLGMPDLPDLPMKNRTRSGEFIQSLRRSDEIAAVVFQAHKEDYERFGFPVKPLTQGL